MNIAAMKSWSLGGGVSTFYMHTSTEFQAPLRSRRFKHLLRLKTLTDQHRRTRNPQDNRSSRPE